LAVSTVFVDEAVAAPNNPAVTNSVGMYALNFLFMLNPLKILNTLLLFLTSIYKSFLFVKTFFSCLTQKGALRGFKNLFYSEHLKKK
jgi:hypothetical protein